MLRKAGAGERPASLDARRLRTAASPRSPASLTPAGTANASPISSSSPLAKSAASPLSPASCSQSPSGRHMPAAAAHAAPQERAAAPNMRSQQLVAASPSSGPHLALQPSSPATQPHAAAALRLLTAVTAPSSSMAGASGSQQMLPMQPGVNTSLPRLVLPSPSQSSPQPATGSHSPSLQSPRAAGVFSSVACAPQSGACTTQHGG